MMNITFVKASIEVEETVALVIDELDHDIDRITNEKFIAVFEKSLNKISSHALFSYYYYEEDIISTWTNKKYIQLLTNEFPIFFLNEKYRGTKNLLKFENNKYFVY
ncbi:hypothetical protein AAHE18_02G046300 [Arachis hypogaea]